MTKVASRLEPTRGNGLAQSILVIGGTGFIGRRVVRVLAERGYAVACLLHVQGAEIFGEMAGRVQVCYGDVTRLEELTKIMAELRPERVLNLSYSLGSDHAPHEATNLNIVGMDNVFEASRLTGVARVVYASSLAVSGRQQLHGERLVGEADPAYGEQQYAMHKRFNEWQAQDYVDKHGMSIVGVRPANGTGPDKLRGSVDHVQCITHSAQGKSVTLPHGNIMRALIHVDDIAEVFVRLLLADAPQHSLYNTGGTPISLWGLTAMIREFLPDARIGFEDERGGRELSGCYLIDNSRLLNEFGMIFPPLRDRVAQTINAVRKAAGLTLIKQP